MVKIAVFAAIVGLVASPFAAQDISVTPLSSIDTNAVGLVSPKNAGLPVNFWRDEPASEIARLISIQNHHKIPEARAFMNRLMVTELAPPTGKHGDVAALVARVDWLLANGALDAADALLGKAGVQHPALFARWFDAKLMLSRNTEACEPLKLNPSLSADLPTKIYCLAQNMDWFSAELTLVSGENLGAIDPERARLLAYFLEPDLMDEGPAPKVQNQSDPLEFTLREALGMPRPSSGITLSQSHIDLDESAGWLAQLRAGENLARVGAIPARYLDALYSDNKASASGGVWERVKAVAKLKRAMAQGDSAVICKALNHAWDEMQKVSLLHVFSDVFAQSIATHNLSADCTETQVNTVLLHPNFGALLFDLVEYIPEKDILRAILAMNFTDTETNTPIETAIHGAFTSQLPILVSPARSILKAMADTAAGTDSDPRSIQRVIETFLAAGFETEAQRLALQYIILDRAK